MHYLPYYLSCILLTALFLCHLKNSGRDPLCCFQDSQMVRDLHFFYMLKETGRCCYHVLPYSRARFLPASATCEWSPTPVCQYVPGKKEPNRSRQVFIFFHVWFTHALHCRVRPLAFGWRAYDRVTPSFG